jgi:hypothetical protein
MYREVNDKQFQTIEAPKAYFPDGDDNDNKQFDFQTLDSLNHVQDISDTLFLILTQVSQC